MSEIAERAAREREIEKIADDCGEFGRWVSNEDGDVIVLEADNYRAVIEKAFTIGRERAIEESRGQRWIPVEEKLPELNAYVWFWVPSLGERGNWETGYFRDSPDEGAEFECERTGPQDEFIVYGDQQVSHWMLAALPDPPKGNENV